MNEPILNRKDWLETVLQQKVGYGNGQKKLLRSIYILLFSEGSQSIVLGLLIPQLDQQWDITNLQKSMLITFVYVGVSIGSFLQSYSDKYGRYRFLLLDAIITTIFGILSALCISFSFFLFTRFIYGIGIGIALPLSATYITEIVPSSHRAQIMSMSRVYWSFGCFFACLISWVFMPSSHWRITLLILSIPNIIALHDLIKNGKESLRYQWMKGNPQKCKIVLDIICEGNKTAHIPYEQVSYEIKSYSQQLRRYNNKQKLEWSKLISDKYKKVTIILCYSWMNCCFNYYVLILILPQILSRHSTYSSNFQYFFIMVISVFQILSFMLSYLFMDNPHLGRKKSLIYCLYIVSLLSFLLMLVGENHYLLLLLIFIGIKISATISFLILYPYSTQIYETKIRSLAMGVLSLSGRIATAMIGIIGISSLDWFGGNGLYLIILISTLINSWGIKQMPYCTLGRELDT